VKKTLLALAAAVLLLAVALFLDHHRDVSRLSSQFAFDTAQKADISYLRVIQQNDTAVLLKTGGMWVTAQDSFPVDTAKMNKDLSYLLSLQSKEMVSSDPARLSEYGLDSNEAKHVEWKTAGGTTYRAVIGKTSGVDYSSTYWKFEDKPEVYNTPGDFTWEVGVHPADWKDRTLSIDDFVALGDTNLPKARLDTPMVDVKIDLNNGNSYDIKGGRTLAGYVYVQDPFRKDIVKLAAGRFDPFKKTPDQLSGKDTGQVAPKQVAAKSAKRTTKVKKH